MSGRSRATSIKVRASSVSKSYERFRGVLGAGTVGFEVFGVLQTGSELTHPFRRGMIVA